MRWHQLVVSKLGDTTHRRAGREGWGGALLRKKHGTCSISLRFPDWHGSDPLWVAAPKIHSVPKTSSGVGTVCANFFPPPHFLPH